MVNRFREFNQKHSLFSREDKVIVGFSGGADSACLLHLLAGEGVAVTAAHLHHGQRAQADADLEWCFRFAERLGVPFVSGRADVPSLAKDRKIGLEEAGREARYGFFERCCQQVGGAIAATAHTLDDNVETVFLNLARGTGLTGMSGIPIKRGNVVRPLLFARRCETESYCREAGIDFLSDACNFDVRFARVRVRSALIPEFETLHPSAVGNASRSIELIGEENRMLDSIAAALLEAARMGDDHPLAFLVEGVVETFRAGILRHAYPALIRRAVRLVVSYLGGTCSLSQAQTATDAILGSGRASVTMEGMGVVVEVTPETLTCRRVQFLPPFDELVPCPGSVSSPVHGWRLVCEATEEEPSKARRSLEAIIDRDSVVGEVRARPFLAGDRIRAFGGDGERKVKKLLGSLKVGLEMKRRLPLLLDRSGIIWIPGVTIADRVKVTGSTTRALRLEIKGSSTD